MLGQTVITVGFDGSEPALAALDWAADHARRRGLPLRVVTAVEIPVRLPAYPPVPVPDVRAAAEQEGKRILDQAVARCQTTAPDLDLTATVEVQTPIRALLHAARASALLVVGCRGHKPLENFFLGSVSTAVSAHAHCPVAVVRGGRQAGPDAPVVAGIDGSERDDATLAAAFDEAASYHAPLVVGYAWNDISMLPTLGTAIAAWPTWDALRDEATVLVERQLADWRAKYPTVPVTTRVACERPAAFLLDLARSAGLLVVGSHGRGGFTGMLLGSVARRLVHHADCPVLVVRQPPAVTAPQEEPCAPATS